MSDPAATHPFSQWLEVTSASVGHHSLRLAVERSGSREVVLDRLRMRVRAHYVAPEHFAGQMECLGELKTAALLREKLPTTKISRSGDLGEILATEIAEQELGYTVPIKRLRWKDGRNVAMRGDDVIGMRNDGGMLFLLKGEAKSCVALTTAVLNKASVALNRDAGQPARHAILFVATRLRDEGREDEALKLERVLSDEHSAHKVEHLLFVFTGSSPQNLLTAHLKNVAKNGKVRHAVGVKIADHQDFVKLLFGGF